MTITEKLNNLISKSNEITGKIDTDLTSAVASLIDGYGGGGDNPFAELDYPSTPQAIIDEIAYSKSATVGNRIIAPYKAKHHVLSDFYCNNWNLRYIQSNFDVSEYTDNSAQQMFYACRGLSPHSTATFTEFPSTVTKLNSAFAGDGGVGFKEITLNGASGITTFESMCNGIRRLEKITMNGTYGDNCSMYRMFYGCTGLTDFIGTHTFKPSNLYQAFCDCKVLKALPNLDFSVVTSLSGAFNTCSTITGNYTVNAPLATSSDYMFAYCYKINGVTASLPLSTNGRCMFLQCNSLTNVSLSNLNVMTNFEYAFERCNSLETVTIPATPKATTFEWCFYNCGKLKEVTITDTPSVTNIKSMFNGCKSLETINVFDTSKVTNMDWMYNGCTSLTDESLNNILAMCINATSYSGNKKLTQLYINNQTIYPASRIAALPNYQSFIDAGWIIGY